MQNNHHKLVKTLNSENPNCHKNHHTWPQFHQSNHSSKILTILYKLGGHQTNDKNGVVGIVFVECSNCKNRVIGSAFQICCLRLKLARFAFA